MGAHTHTSLEHVSHLSARAAKRLALEGGRGGTVTAGSLFLSFRFDFFCFCSSTTCRGGSDAGSPGGRTGAAGSSEGGSAAWGCPCFDFGLRFFRLCLSGWLFLSSRGLEASFSVAVKWPLITWKEKSIERGRPPSRGTSRTHEAEWPKVRSSPISGP